MNAFLIPTAFAHRIEYLARINVYFANTLRVRARVFPPVVDSGIGAILSPPEIACCESTDDPLPPIPSPPLRCHFLKSKIKDHIGLLILKPSGGTSLNHQGPGNRTASVKWMKFVCVVPALPLGPLHSRLWVGAGQG